MNTAASTLEITSFRTRPGVDEERLRAAIARSNLWLGRCPGFLARHLGREPSTGLWREVIEWTDHDSAAAAAAEFGQAEETQDFLACIDFDAPETGMAHVDLLADYEAEVALAR